MSSVAMTSGNVSEEPIVRDDKALTKLDGIADLFLGLSGDNA